jgi:hypothetical protein
MVKVIGNHITPNPSLSISENDSIPAQLLGNSYVQTVGTVVSLRISTIAVGESRASRVRGVEVQQMPSSRNIYSSKQCTCEELTHFTIEDS